jgi:hypothetical protein
MPILPEVQVFTHKAFSFNGKPQASAKFCDNAYGLPLND